MNPLRSVRLEQGMIVVRWLGAAGAIGFLALTGDSAAPRGPRWIGWVLVVALVVGNVVLWRWANRDRAVEEDRFQLIAFVFDVAMILAFCLLLARLDVDPAWSLAIFLPIEGAFRRALLGAVVGGAVAIAIAVGTFAVGRTATEFGGADLAFTAVIIAALSGIAGTVTQAWRARRVDYERQAARFIELDRLKDRYIAVTSHEIRGPLTAMMAAVDTVRQRWDKISPERRDQLLEMVYSQGRSLDRLVEDLMISAEVQAGRLIMHPEWTELLPIVRRALDAAAGKRRAHLLEVFVDPIRCELDQNRVSQIVRNLVENAYKYTPDRTRVAVTAKAVQGGVHLEIADDGDGIPPEKRSQLFEAFSRIEETAAGQEGVGLGLYVVSQLVAAMDGRIDLTSSAQGTIFSIFIPCNRASVSQPRIGLVKDEGEQASG